MTNFKRVLVATVMVASLAAFAAVTPLLATVDKTCVGKTFTFTAGSDELPKLWRPVVKPDGKALHGAYTSFNAERRVGDSLMASSAPNANAGSVIVNVQGKGPTGPGESFGRRGFRNHAAAGELMYEEPFKKAKFTVKVSPRSGTPGESVFVEVCVEPIRPDICGSLLTQEPDGPCTRSDQVDLGKSWVSIWSPDNRRIELAKKGLLIWPPLHDYQVSFGGLDIRVIIKLDGTAVADHFFSLWKNDGKTIFSQGEVYEYLDSLVLQYEHDLLDHR